MNTNEKMQMQDDSGTTDAHTYRRLVGGFIYLVNTKPDLAYSVGMVSRYMSNPTKFHFSVAKRILRYISGTLDFGLWYEHVSVFNLIGFSDSDWAGSMEDRKSTSGSVFILGSTAITWSSKKQHVTALSTTEAEYIAVTASACQAIWLQRLISDMGQDIGDAIQIFCNNKSTISIAKNPTLHGRTKHIDIRYHFIRELISNGKVILKFCSTEDQKADMFTKALGVQKFTLFRSLIGVINYSSRGCVKD